MTLFCTGAVTSAANAPVAQARGEIAIDFDGRDVARALDQACRQRAQTRSDLDDVVARMRIDRIDNARCVMRIGKKILTEPLAGDVAVHLAVTGD